MKIEYSSPDSEWADYGVLNASFAIARPDKKHLQMSHEGVGIFVHPATCEYTIFNYPWKNSISPELPLYGLKKGDESIFFKELENKYPNIFTREDWHPELLLKSKK
jgi:hypothetical protein